MTHYETYSNIHQSHGLHPYSSQLFDTGWDQEKKRKHPGFDFFVTMGWGCQMTKWLDSDILSTGRKLNQRILSALNKCLRKMLTKTALHHEFGEG